MQRLEVSGAVRHTYTSLGDKGLIRGWVSFEPILEVEAGDISQWPVATLKCLLLT
jgi:hypothetical protein